MCGRSRRPREGGTHNHRRFDLGVAARLGSTTSAGGYGSPPSRGRLIGLLLALFSTPAFAGDDALVTYKSLSPEVALEAAIPKADMATDVSARELAAIAAMKVRLEAYVAATAACEAVSHAGPR